MKAPTGLPSSVVSLDQAESGRRRGQGPRSAKSKSDPLDVDPDYFSLGAAHWQGQCKKAASLKFKFPAEHKRLPADNIPIRCPAGEVIPVAIAVK
jgi:hypothetical protein